MTILDSLAAGGNTVNTDDLSAIAAATLSNQSSTQFVLYGTGFTVTVRGSGFTFSGGHVSGGTITSLWFNKTSGSGLPTQGWSYFSVPAVTLWNAISTGAVTTFTTLIFGGDDSFYPTGTNVTVNGFGGNDTFEFYVPSGSVQFPTIDGGEGTDIVNVSGNLPSNHPENGPLSLPDVISNVEVINLSAGYSYKLSTYSSDDLVAAGSNLKIDGSALRTTDVFTFDGSSEADGTFELVGGAGADSLRGGTGNDLLYGGGGIDTLSGGAGCDVFFAGDGNDLVYGGDDADTMTGGLGNDTLDGGSNVDIAVFAGTSTAYTITQGIVGAFTVSGSDGTDVLTNIEYAEFQDKTVRLLPGSGATIDWSADPSTYMASIRDFDGNDLGSASGWKLIGTADVNGDGTAEHILVNRLNGRWAEVATEADGKSYFANHGWAGDTRVVGIYIDPLVTSGEVVAGSDFDSQRRFQNDLNIENIHGILGQNDYNHDGLQEIYFSLTDGTAYLHAYMHADGNVQYANYQNEQQVKDYLTSNGYTSTAWAGWFPVSQNPLAAAGG